MSREIIIAAWCDRCEAAERKTPATHTYTVGIVKGENRPAVRVLEFCDDCDPMLAELQDLLAKHSIPLDPQAPKPAPATVPTYRSTEPIDCRICGLTLSRSSLVTHIWTRHRAGEIRPAAPTRCPECRQTYEPQGMSMHRTKMHGYSAIEDAYAGVSA